MSDPVTFYFDFISPFAYLAWHQIHDFVAPYDRSVEPRPILFAALLNHHGHKGPAEIPPKRVYVFKHAVRLADGMGIPLLPPPAHPFNPLLALRVAGLEMTDAERRTAIEALFAAVWGGGTGVTEPGAVVGALSAAGLDGDGLVARAQEAEAKARLRASTDDAIARGVFGVPTAIVDDELFWGCDSLPHLDRFLAGLDPVTPELLDRWRDLPAQARRAGA